MRKSAAEYIRSLEMRIARLERQASSRAHSKSAGRFRMDSSTKRELLKELKSHNSLAGKITRESVLKSEEYSSGRYAYIVRIDYDDPMMGSDEVFAVITQEGRDQNFYGLYEDRSDAEDTMFFN